MVYDGPGQGTFYGKDAYSYYAGFPIGAIIPFLVLIAIQVRLLTRKENPEPDGYPGVGSQSFAFLIDFVSNLVLLSGFLSLIALSMEFADTGEWRWMVERDEEKRFDALIGFLVLPQMFLMGFSFALPVALNKQSFGQNVFGFKVFQENRIGFVDALTRTLFGAIALFFWPFALYWAIRDERKQFWPNRHFKTYCGYIKRRTG